jgi:hypothetical protein
MRYRRLIIQLVCVLITTLWTNAFSAPVEAEIKSMNGTAEFKTPETSAFQPLKVGQKLVMGTTIRTGDDGMLVVLTVPGAAIKLGPKSELALNELEFAKTGDSVTARKATLDLKSGTVSALIQNNEPKVTDFKIKTPQGIAAARGTFFAVTVEDGQSHVAVKEGKVGLQKNQTSEKE